MWQRLLALALPVRPVRPARRPLSLINGVRALIAGHDLPAAERLARAYQARIGPTPGTRRRSLLAGPRAVSDAKNFDQADALAAGNHQNGSRFLMGQKLDDDPWLPTAARRRHRSPRPGPRRARRTRPRPSTTCSAQLKQFAGTSLAERIRKNINLLNLEGKPAPALDEKEWLGPQAALPRRAARPPRPALLLGALVQRLQSRNRPSSPTCSAPSRRRDWRCSVRLACMGMWPAARMRRRKKRSSISNRFADSYYAALADMPAPLSAANFIAYGASTTPTLVLIDRAGVVRYYHPGAASEAELTARIRSVLRK